MPQTREHLAVLSLLGMTRGAVAITKCDRVDADRLAVVQAEVQACCRARRWPAHRCGWCRAAPARAWPSCRRCCSTRHASCHRVRPRAPRSAWRWTAPSRSTAWAPWSPAPCMPAAWRWATSCSWCPARHARACAACMRRTRPVTQAQAGQRTAVALAGLAKDQVTRGQWLVAPAVALQTLAAGCAADAVAGRDQGLAQRHAGARAPGAADVMGTVAVLDGGESLAPGRAARVQLVLQQPLAPGGATVSCCATPRPRARWPAAGAGPAGAGTLPPHAPAAERTDRAAALPTLASRRAALLEVAPHGRGPAAWRCSASGRCRRWGRCQARTPGGHWALGAQQASAPARWCWRRWPPSTNAAPDDPGPDAARLRRLALPRLPEPLWRRCSTACWPTACVARSGAFVHLPEHGVRLSATEQRLAQKVGPRLAEGHFDGVWVRDLARDAQESEALMRTTLVRLAQRGELHQVVKDLYYAEPTIAHTGTHRTHGGRRTTARSLQRPFATPLSWAASGPSRSWNTSTASGCCAGWVTCTSCAATRRCSSGTPP
jgi:selenocysteine-specific elongation factor